MIRAELMVRQALRELMSIIHARLSAVKLSGQRVENNIIFAVLAFMLIWEGQSLRWPCSFCFGLDIVTALGGDRLHLQ